MVANQRGTGRAMSMPAGLALSGSVSITVTVILSSIIALAAERELLQENAIGYAVMVLLLIASVLGAVTAKIKIKRRKLMTCILSGVIYYGLLLGITALFFGGQYQGMGVTGLLILGGSLLPALLEKQGRGGAKAGRKKYAYR